MLLFFLVFFVKSIDDAADDDDEGEEEFVKILTKDDFIQENIEMISKCHDPPPRSSVAFVTTYTNDQPPFYGYLQLLVTVGYSLKLFNPNIDRVVILREEYRSQPLVIKMISKAWTHVLYRPAIRWPSEYYKKGDVYHAKWFKFHAWTLTQYKKIIVMGCDLLIFCDISPLFKYQTPAASMLLSDYTIKDDGPIFNSDFMIIEPNVDTFCSLLELTLPYINHETKDRDTLGPDDSAPLNTYYRREISLMPLLIMHENGGYKHTVLGDPRDPYFHIIRGCIVHFVGKGKPWRRWTGYTEIWANFAVIMFDKLDIPFKLKGAHSIGSYLWDMVYGPSQDKKLFWTPDSDDEDDEIGEDYYPEPKHSGVRKNLAMVCLVVFISLLMLKVVIKSNNPFNVFLKRWEEKINEFIKLEDEEPPMLIDGEVESDDENQEPKKPHKKRRRKKKKSHK